MKDDTFQLVVEFLIRSNISWMAVSDIVWYQGQPAYVSKIYSLGTDYMIDIETLQEEIIYLPESAVQLNYDR